MNVKKISIDWKRKFKGIDSQISGEGGLICVAGTVDSAWKTFSKLVRSRIKEKNPHSNIIQLNPSDGMTRTPAEIIAKLENTLIGSGAQYGELKVAADITAGKNVNIKDVNINQRKTEHGIAAETFFRVDEIVNHIKEMETDRRLVIFFEECHKMPAPCVSWFWKDFWAERISHMTGRGLLLVCSCESDKGSCAHGDSDIAPKKRIRLLNQYNEGESKIAAGDIAAAIRKKTGESLEIAQLRADTLLRSCDFTPSKVYSGLNNLFLNPGAHADA